MTSSNRRRLSSGLSGGLSGAGAGAQIGTAFAPGIGTAIGAGVGLLAGGLGGALTPDEDPNAMTDFQKQQLELERAKMAQDEKQFGLSFGQKSLTDRRSLNLEGLKMLAGQRQEAQGRMRKYNFRNDLISAAQGA